MAIDIHGTINELHCQSLNDSGLLITLGGKSYTVYARDDVSGLRLIIDGKTCILEKEHDPTQLRSPSPGKIVRFLVDNDDQVSAGTVYAEIEVMKMVLPLVTTEYGCIRLKKQPGAMIEAGDVLAVLKLKDQSRMKRFGLFDGQFPDLGPLRLVKVEKPCQRLNYLRFEISSYFLK
jgi:acetyl-CoA carboxylase/biotin carboxylase 1